LTAAAHCASAAAACPATSGRSSSPITTPGFTDWDTYPYASESLHQDPVLIPNHWTG
jgi:hypothetical protein